MNEYLKNKRRITFIILKEKLKSNLIKINLSQNLEIIKKREKMVF
jgi:hypothetical protein